ncbi:MAG: hypothetical protein JO235_06460 [Chroococcidiopsidaceae cyanobacterium CP_BM_RX_35]|nr:hypothetical protein [Chroococcidiopsidaceae cyanobacterium CP_BM_RX_35]
MLFFITTWIILTLVCFSIGTATLNIFKADCFEQRGDRLLAAIWLGIVILAISLLTGSLFFPLSSLVSLSITTILISLSLLSHRTRTEIVALRSSLAREKILGFLTLEVVVSVLTTQQIKWFDTGLYHLGSIRWLSEFGAIYGVALINAKFGFSSSWFAFSAPFTPESLGNHVGAITNSFVFLIAITHFLIALTQIFKDRSRLSSSFVFVYLSILTSVYLVKTLIGASPLVSFSPDVPVNLLIGVTAWTILIICQAKSSSMPNPNNSVFDARIIPLILSSGAVTFKLSALPLLLIGILFYILEKRFKFQRFLLGSIIIILLLLPLTIFGIKTSGCPLYPSRFMCLNVPWSVPLEQSKEEVSKIKFLWAVTTKEQSNIENIFSMFSMYCKMIKFHVEYKIMAFLVVISTISSLQILQRSKPRQLKEQIWLVLLGISGIAFIITQSPLLRFGLGYFILVPCLFIARLIRRLLNDRLSLIVRYYLIFTRLRITIKIVSLLLFIIVSLLSFIPIDGGIKSRWLLPAELPSIQVVNAEVNDVKYSFPAGWTVRCWAYKLPCAPVPINENIRLRNPSRGIGAGFVRTKDVRR